MTMKTKKIFAAYVISYLPVSNWFFILFKNQYYENNQTIPKNSNNTYE